MAAWLPVSLKFDGRLYTLIINKVTGCKAFDGSVNSPIIAKALENSRPYSQILVDMQVLEAISAAKKRSYDC